MAQSVFVFSGQAFWEQSCRLSRSQILYSIYDVGGWSRGREAVRARKGSCSGTQKRKLLQSIESRHVNLA
jgi:hypothetical protein